MKMVVKWVKYEEDGVEWVKYEENGVGWVNNDEDRGEGRFGGFKRICSRGLVMWWIGLRG